MKKINKKLMVTAIATALMAGLLASPADAGGVFLSFSAPSPGYYANPMPIVPPPVAYAPRVAYAPPMYAPAPVVMAPYPTAYYYRYGPQWHHHHHHQWDGHRRY